MLISQPPAQYLTLVLLSTLSLLHSLILLRAVTNPGHHDRKTERRQEGTMALIRRSGPVALSLGLALSLRAIKISAPLFFAGAETPRV